jgi:hypothetical protein
MRMSATRQEMLFIRRDFNSSEALANVTAAKPADSNKSFVVSRIDSSSSTIATSGLFGTQISTRAVR